MGAPAQAVAIQRERLLKAQAEWQELKNAEHKRLLVTVEAAERAWSDELRVLRAGMLALPSRVAQRLPHLTRGDKSLIEDEVRVILTELSEGRSEPSSAGPEAAPEASTIDLDRIKPAPTRGRKRSSRTDKTVAVPAGDS